MKVVITSVRNEADYLVEWVAWNIFIGFDKVVVYTNHNTDSTLTVLEALQLYGVVEYQELFPTENDKPQMLAFREGIKWLEKHKPKWVSCLDPDEFICLKKDRNIDEYLLRFPDADAIAINWKIFGSSGIKHKGKGLTIERFLLAANEVYKEHRQFKSVFRYKPNIERFHHRVIYSRSEFNEVNYIYSDGMPLSEDAKRPGFDLNVNNYITFEYAQINHYTIRSMAELLSKMKRGNGIDSVGENRKIESYIKTFDRYDYYEIDILERLDEYMVLYEKISNFVSDYIGCELRASS